MSTLESLSDNEVEEVISSSSTPVLLDFSASWCGPCKTLTPVLEKMAEDYKGTIRICKVDVDDAPEVATKFGIRSVPTLIAFSKGQKLAQAVGVVSREKILKLFEL